MVLYKRYVGWCNGQNVLSGIFGWVKGSWGGFVLSAICYSPEDQFISGMLA